MIARWNRLARHGMSIVVALLLAVALGATDLLDKTRRIGMGLSAPRLVCILDAGSALALSWRAAYRASLLIRSEAERRRAIAAKRIGLSG